LPKHTMNEPPATSGAQWTNTSEVNLRLIPTESKKNPAVNAT
jgi:hypothetical protein